MKLSEYPSSAHAGNNTLSFSIQQHEVVLLKLFACFTPLAAYSSSLICKCGRFDKWQGSGKRCL